MKHLYEVETNGCSVKVEARSRGEARKMVERMGYTVRSVNMIG